MSSALTLLLSDGIIANKANVISRCMPSAPLLTTNPFSDLIIWHLGFINQIQLPAWLTISAVHRTTIYWCPCLLTAYTYCTLSSAGLFKCRALLSTQGQEHVFIFVGYCWFAFPACNAYMVTVSRPQWTVLMLLLSPDWRLRRGWAAFRHHSLKRLSCRVDGLKTETLTRQTSQSLMRLFSNIFDFIRSSVAGIIVWLLETKLREWYLQRASIRKRKRSS